MTAPITSAHVRELLDGISEDRGWLHNAIMQSMFKLFVADLTPPDAARIAKALALLEAVEGQDETLVEAILAAQAERHPPKPGSSVSLYHWAEDIRADLAVLAKWEGEVMKRSVDTSAQAPGTLASGGRFAVTASAPPTSNPADVAELTHLRARLAELEGALRPFARAWDKSQYLAEAHWSDFSAARQALGGSDGR